MECVCVHYLVLVERDLGIVRLVRKLLLLTTSFSDYVHIAAILRLDIP